MLAGRRLGQTVSFLKTYQGTSFSGFKIGERTMGTERASHAVHYEGQLSADGCVIDGRWWIDADPRLGIPMVQGLFILRRTETRGILTEEQDPALKGPKGEKG
jgi:hypothetical protein